MRSRLFRTIFWNSCLTFLLQLLLMGAVFTFVAPFDPRLARLVGERSGPERLELALRLVAAAGPSALPRGDGFKVIALPTDIARLKAKGSLEQEVQAPDGHRYRVTLELPKVATPVGLVAPQIYGIGLVTVILSAASLAYYLSRPVRVLRSGLTAFAAGGLGTRVAHRMGRRRDEIAELAHDFDDMAENIERLVSARDQLLDDVSHELRSPLARLQLAIALARQNPVKRADALDRIEREASRLDALVAELLTLSRLESGAPLIEGYFDLALLIEAVVADARFEGEHRGVTIDFEVEGSEATMASEVAGDAELVRRAYENVLRNALRFSPPSKRILVTLSLGGDNAISTVQDEGPGVPPDRLGSLFDAFVKGRDGGWGLGLAIAKRAVVAHGGALSARNRAEGGLMITFVLPLSKSARIWPRRRRS